MSTFIHRVIGAAVLDVNTYEEVEADERATPQALAVILLSSVCAGLGVRRAAQLETTLFISTVALLSWAAWALLTYEIGARLFPEPQTRVDIGQMLRTIGFASAPGILRIFGVIPELTVPLFALSAAWMLVAMVVAVRQALDYTSTARALAVCGVGWVLAIVMALVVGIFFGPGLS